jgi:hypothetical protein
MVAGPAVPLELALLPLEADEVVPLEELPEELPFEPELAPPGAVTVNVTSWALSRNVPLEPSTETYAYHWPVGSENVNVRLPLST